MKSISYRMAFLTGCLLATLPMASAWCMESAAHVHVNGAHLTGQQIQQFKTWNCGGIVPSGDYWFDYSTGAWGYTRGARQGYLKCYPTAGNRTSPDKGKSYWEDRVHERSCALGQCLDVITNPVYK